jgi:hypothetical protein
MTEASSDDPGLRRPAGAAGVRCRFPGHAYISAQRIGRRLTRGFYVLE